MQAFIRKLFVLRIGYPLFITHHLIETTIKELSLVLSNTIRSVTSRQTAKLLLCFCFLIVSPSRQRAAAWSEQCGDVSAENLQVRVSHEINMYVFAISQVSIIEEVYRNKAE